MSRESDDIRHDWTLAGARSIYDLPFPELVYRAQSVHRRHNDPVEIQLCSLLSIKTGGCPEDCSYCPQSAHNEADVGRDELLEVEDVVRAAHVARDNGASRFCMGAAWREVRDGREFDAVLEMVRGVRELGLETCCTLGMLTDEQVDRLAEVGLTAYNHNLDTGPAYYNRIITTRTYEDRLQTLQRLQRAGISICSGGILGMGEEVADRLEMLCVLASLDPHPESVPVNALVPVEGTPLADRPTVSSLEMARTVATARILMPRSRVRLSAGRVSMTPEAQALCFLAGANSIFSGQKLLTTPNADEDDDRILLDSLGLRTTRASEGEDVGGELLASESADET